MGQAFNNTDNILFTTLLSLGCILYSLHIVKNMITVCDQPPNGFELSGTGSFLHLIFPPKPASASANGYAALSL
jgi:hypothetical protein